MGTTFDAIRPDAAVRKRLSGLAIPAFVALLFLLGSGCGSARAGRFEAFAVAGVSYSKARDSFLRQSVETYIERDTLELRRERPARDPAGRVALLAENDAIVRERIEIINDLQRHGQVLADYFAALSRLATSKEDVNAGAAADRLSSELGGLTNALAQKSFKGTPISQLIGQGTKLAVGAFRNRALSRHLQENAATIDRELQLEEALLGEVADEMMADLKALQADERRIRVVVPFREAATLPTSWDQDRKRLLLEELDMAKARLAQDAARQLRLSFQSLAGGGEEAGVAALQSAVEQLSSFVNTFAANRNGAAPGPNP